MGSRGQTQLDLEAPSPADRFIPREEASPCVRARLLDRRGYGRKASGPPEPRRRVRPRPRRVCKRSTARRWSGGPSTWSRCWSPTPGRGPSGKSPGAWTGARAADGRACAFRPQCCPGVPSRALVHRENVPAVVAYMARRQTEAARGAYRWRAPLAEFTHAWLKAKLGLRQFCVRGLMKARCEVLWACLTYNIQQGFRLRWKVREAGVPA